MICYIAYPTSLTLQSANALQTYTTLRELRARRPDTLAFIPRWGREPSRFSEVGATHLPRPAIGKLSRLHKSTLLYYLEHSAFAFMTAAILQSKIQNSTSNIEAVYVRQVICAAWWAGVLGPRLGIPVIYEAHDMETRNPSRAKEPWATGLLHLIDRVALTRSSAVVSLTDDFRHYLAGIGWRRPEEVFVVPDAYDAQQFAPQDKAACRAALGLPAEADVITYAGMTFSHRWLDGLLEAAARLRESHPRLLLLLVGGRPQEIENLTHHAQKLGLPITNRQSPVLPFDRLTSRESEGSIVNRQSSIVNRQFPTIIFTGPKPQAEVVRYLGAADALVIPDTVTDVTASPLKLFEYMALGQPLVLPSIPALREIVPPANGHYFPRRDLSGLTSALAAALGAKNDSAAAAARRALAADHTYGRRAERILAVVEQVRL
ncbi:MAG: glycosyltransferase [Chloroflexaceae bacterium]|jgi:glycosyltransferase involved in cell wall biosynthesis|nr:glycosyltransferase [Chloroflexaceae bacterium]